jgi:predicted nucleotidyltransferase
MTIEQAVLEDLRELPTDKQQEVLDFIQFLNQYEVDYMIVGGYAMAFHGSPRYTGDLDVWIDISESNAEKMLLVIQAFGFSSLGFKKEDFLKENLINQIGYPPLRIDILTNIDGIDFKEAYTQKQVIEIEDLKANYIGLRDLIQNKKTSGREKDIIDVKTLQKKQKPID